MSGTLKSAGADCPKCRDPYPAEYAQAGQRPRWSCTCGASGDLTGRVAGATPPVAAPAQGPKPAPVWGRNLLRSRL